MARGVNSRSAVNDLRAPLWRSRCGRICPASKPISSPDDLPRPYSGLFLGRRFDDRRLRRSIKAHVKIPVT
jgi:hypothetical protein